VENHQFDIVAMAASAGGLAALSKVLSLLPGDFRVPVVIVEHLDPRRRSLMAEILSRRISLPATEAMAGEHLEPRRVYIAPPDNHLLIDSEGIVSLSHSELVHFVRPSADLLFESVAAAYKDRAIAVVLSGSGVDGNLGIKAIKKMGGMVIAQNQKTSQFFGMPDAAIRTGCVDFILPLEEIPQTLIKLVMKGETV
jgi:two-component system chemotaxis response regulator CheB